MAIFLALILLGAETSFAQDPIKVAAQLVDIRSKTAHPFQLDIDFTAQNEVAQQGHLREIWLSKEVWLKEISMGDFRQVTMRKGENRYTLRNLPFTPLRITELEGLTSVLWEDSWETKKSKKKSEDGKDYECFQQQYHPEHGAGKTNREVCLDAASGEIFREESRESDGSLARQEFTNYQEFLGHQNPREMKLTHNGSLFLRAIVTSLESTNSTDADLVPPPGAKLRRECEHMQNPVPLKTPDPLYPRSAAANRHMGTTTVSLTVKKDGSVDDIQILGTAGSEMDKATKDTLRTWRFKPAMCGNDAVDKDIMVEVNFKLW